MSRHTSGWVGTTQYHNKTSHGGGRGSKISQKCHALFEWPLIEKRRKYKASLTGNY